MNLVGITCARNEKDILKASILWHLEQGVDLVLVRIDGATDGTYESIKELSSNNPKVILLDFTSQELFVQGKILTEMLEIAKKEYQADYVIAFDADEFWSTNNNQSLKQFLSSNPTAIFMAKPFNIGPDLKEEVFIEPPYTRLTKLCYPSDIISVIEIGSHSVINKDGTAIKQADHQLTYYHIPIRSWEQFEQKVSNGGNRVIRIAGSNHWAGNVDRYKNNQLYKRFQDFSIAQKNITLPDALKVTEFYQQHSN